MASDSRQGKLYKNIGQDNTYEIVTGKFVLPVAQATPANSDATYQPVVIVQAFAPYRIRQVAYQANKEVNPPQIPTPTDSGPYTFIGGVVSIPLPSWNTSGFLNWKVATQYVFIENVYTDLNSGYVLGQPPVVWSSQVADVNNASQNGPIITQQSGIGPKVGYGDSLNLSISNPDYLYPEPSYFPSFFHSNDLISGPTDYSGLPGGQF